jgi:hypothetical protein
MMRIRSIAGTLGLLLALATTARAAAPGTEVSTLLARADEALSSGGPAPEGALSPVLAALRLTQDARERSRLIDGIVWLHRGGRGTQAEARRYLIQQATPVLAEIAAHPGNDGFLRVDALAALCELGAPRSVLERLAAVTATDDHPLVRSRSVVLLRHLQALSAGSGTVRLQQQPAPARPASR